MIMISLTSSDKFRRWSKEIGHAIAILILTIGLSIFLGDFTFLRGSEAIYKGLFRFFRISLLLCLPLYLLFPIFGRLGKVALRKDSAFLQVEERQDLEFHPVKHRLLIDSNRAVPIWAIPYCHKGHNRYLSSSVNVLDSG